MLSQCRMFLKATTLADIVIVDGKAIMSWALDGKASNTIRPHIQWPRQPPCLSTQHWRLWKVALEKTFLPPYRSPNSRALSRPLLAWDASKISLHKVWPCWYSSSYRKLYRREGLMWKMADTTGRRQGSRRTRFTFHGTSIRELPTHAECLVSIYTEGTSFVIESEILRTSIVAAPQSTRTPTLQSLTENNAYLVDEIAPPLDQGSAIAAGIRAGTAKAVSDGSYKDQYGTSAGIISSSESDGDMLYFVNSVPGIPSDQGSYRSELAGILGTLHITESLCNQYQITSGSLTMALDGKEALLQASRTNQTHPLLPGQHSFDLIQAIRKTCQLLPITIHWRWVEGHQYEKGKRLDWWGAQNQTADILAKKYWNTCQQESTPNSPRPLHNENLYISIVYTRVTCMPDSTAHRHYRIGVVKRFSPLS